MTKIISVDLLLYLWVSGNSSQFFGTVANGSLTSWYGVIIQIWTYPKTSLTHSHSDAQDAVNDGKPSRFFPGGDLSCI